MASKRMFANSVIDLDSFFELSGQAQLLYFHLGMKADDEGFVSPVKVLRILNIDSAALHELIDSGFLIGFETSNVVAITHWRQNNEIKNDRSKPTTFQTERKQLVITENKTYSKLEPNCLQSVSKTLPQNRLAQNSPDQTMVAQGSPGERSPEGRTSYPPMVTTEGQKQKYDRVERLIRDSGFEFTKMAEIMVGSYVCDQSITEDVVSDCIQKCLQEGKRETSDVLQLLNKKHADRKQDVFFADMGERK